MTCKKKKICNMCDAPFKMERGCLLEKRCPACRILRISSRTYMPFYESRYRLFVKQNYPNFRQLCFYPEDEFLNTIQSWFGFEEEFMSSSEDIILKEEENKIIRNLLVSINPREAIAVEEVTMEDETLSHTSEILEVTRERVRQIHSSGIKKLKHPRIARPVKNFLHGIDYNI